MGVCPTSPHVLCGSGEGIRPCPSWYSVGSAPARTFSMYSTTGKDEGKMEREIDRRIGAASAVMQSVYRTVVVKKELSRKAEALDLLVNLCSHSSTYGHGTLGND
ncbi:hypothetical protein L3Q82_026799 [Scortum barcoo]|uniref:Uncharacterized protein n=1 Tax=Scortum barcoo TaxID=214431 RepID=A0ACB8WKJ3_9TELE|nr:hypothetical protein L3Q82_026799 [Scortum barcoo]